MAHDPRALVRARGALNDARSHISTAAAGVRQTRHGAVDEATITLDAVDTELLAAWEAIAYADAELAAYLGGD